MFNSLMTRDQRYFGGAAGLRYESIVETLLSSRAALDTTDYEGRTALQFAASVLVNCSTYLRDY